MADNIYSREEQVRIREAFIDLYLKNKNLPKDDFEELLKEKIYTLGDSPRSVQAFLRQDGVARNFYREHKGLKALPYTTSIAIFKIFDPSQIRVPKLPFGQDFVSFATSKENNKVIKSKYETVAGTPLDNLRKLYDLKNPLSYSDLETLYVAIDNFVSDMETRGHSKEWNSILESIPFRERDLQIWFGDKPTPFSVLIIVMVFILLGALITGVSLLLTFFFPQLS